MKKAALALALFVVGGNAVSVQQFVPTSATFSFTAPTHNAVCEVITSWNGVPNAYPQDMGAVCFNGDNGYGSSLFVPSELGFLNNGFLSPCDAIAWDPKNFTLGDGTHSGDLFSVHGSAACPYFVDEYGADVSHFLVSFTVDANYQVVIKTVYSPRSHRYVSTLGYALLGGSGEVTQVPAS
jgi:hypothetical protein